jgi:NhaP-type Na+/H+ or K+/H+ antiporter
LPASDPFHDAEEALRQAERGPGQVQGAIDIASARERFRVRGAVSLLIVRAYVVGVGLLILYLMIRGLTEGVDVYESISEVLKVLALPVVTFVIGHYFGSASK